MHLRWNPRVPFGRRLNAQVADASSVHFQSDVIARDQSAYKSGPPFVAPEVVPVIEDEVDAHEFQEGGELDPDADQDQREVRR